MPKNGPAYDALIAYVPVIHRGYLELFKKFRGVAVCYILGSDLLAETDYLRKELRAITPEEACRLIHSLGLFSRVEVLNKAGLAVLDQPNVRVVLPDEDVSRHVAKAYLNQAHVDFYPVFLRWNRDNVNADQGSRDVPVSTKKNDFAMMAQAYEVATKSPDIWRQVGAVLVQDGTVAATASNQPLTSQNTPWAEGDPRGLAHRGEAIELSNFLHAEARIVANAAHQGAGLAGAEVFVTTFPCPACAMLLATSGIKKLCFSQGYAVLDGLRALQEAGVEVVRVPAVPAERPGSVPYPKKTTP